MSATASWRLADGKATNVDSGLSILLRHTGLLRDLPEDAMPSRPRGDQKERTFNLLIRDGIDDRGISDEKELIGTTEGAADGSFARDESIPAEHQAVFGEILDDHYVVEGKKVRFLFPFQSYLPGQYKFQGNYKMFNGKVFAFLCQPTREGPGFNTDLIQRFYDLFNNEEDLTLLDRRVLELARSTAGRPEPHISRQETLLNRHYDGGPEPPTPPGAVLPDAHLRFQKDLETVLDINRLNRRDKVNAAVNVFYVHLALYFQRLGWLLDAELSSVLEGLRDHTIPLDAAHACFASAWHASPFTGSVQFRVSTGRSQAVRGTDAAVTSYREQNRRQLLLPANLSLLGAARQVMAACGEDSTRWTFADMASACRANPSLETAFSSGLTLMAEATVADQPRQREDVARQIESGASGLETLREALLKVGRSALRRHGRDIVHGLVHRGGRGYISSRGRNTFFFEIGQDLLLLLAKVIVRDTQMPFRKFVGELEGYGFRVQSRAEQDRLAETLRALNLLEKHSDAGEAMYVKHFL